MNQPPLPIAAFDEILKSLEGFVAMSADLGQLVGDAAIYVEQAFHRLADLILFGLYNDAPPNRAEFFQRHPLNAAIQTLVDFAQAHSKEPFGDHIQCLSSSILALNWIAAERNPAAVVSEMIDAGEYYGNRVRRIKEHKPWYNKWNEVLVELRNYVRSHFLTGFTWGALRSAQVAVPPPPPPPPAEGRPCRPETFRPEESGQGDRMRREMLLSELNQGTDITRRLRPSSARSVQPHSIPRPVTEAQAAPLAQAAPRAANARPPRVELDGRKWIVENQQNAQGIKIENASMSESLSMFRCENSSVEVVNKINSVVIDNCKRSNVLIRGVVGSVGLVRCSRINIQFEGPVPLINVDNCDSIQIFLDETSRGAVLISSQSTSLNICLLKDEGDYVELPVPEQIRTEVQGQQLHSTVYENRG